MRARLGAAAFAAVLGALSSVLLLVLFYAASPGLRLDFLVDPPRLVSGMHPAERDAASGLTFAWSTGDVVMRLPGLDRRTSWTMTLRVRGGRPAAADNPAMTFFVDGVRVHEEPSQTEFAIVSFVIPARVDRPRGAAVGLRTSSTFVPGPADPRPLGVMVDWIAMRPEALVLAPPSAMGDAAASGAGLAAAVGLLGVTPGSAIGASVLLGAAQGAAIARGFGPYTSFPATVRRLAWVVGLVLVLAGAAIELARRAPLRNTARFALAFTAAAVFLKLLVLLHPAMPVGDALFHAHRFQEVLRGNLYFTSVAPGNYLFPYAPGLYVAASPLADLVRREAGDVILLRTFSLAVDAVAAASLYALVIRGWADRRAAAFATGVYQLIPLTLLVLTVANLTNAFAQSVAVLAFVLMGSPWVSTARPLSVVALTAVLVAAFLSHTSTFAIVAPATLVAAALLAWRGGPALRSAAGAVGAAGVAASLLAVALYYGQFGEVYRTELARIGQETAAAAPDAGGRSIAERAMAVPWFLHGQLGLAIATLGVAGWVLAWRSGARDRLTLVMAAWTLTCGAFLGLGIATPVDMRYYLAVMPALALGAASAASAGWRAGGRWRAAVVVLLGWAVATSVRTWWRVLDA